MTILNEYIVKKFGRLIDGSPGKKRINNCVNEILARHLFNCDFRNYWEPIRQFEKIANRNFEFLNSIEKVNAKMGLIAAFAMKLMNSIGELDLPDSIIELYPNSFLNLYDYLSIEKPERYDISNDLYCKDVRFVLGLSIPCGAQKVDKISSVNPISVLLSTARSRTASPLIKYLKNEGYGKWFRIHTDPRNLQDFNEDGWDKCYRRIADLLKKRKHIKGMVGTSWFYDPQLLNISPRLAYLWRKPIERGAFMLKHGTSKSDIERATTKSKTRKELYNKGKYIPISYSILWPRNPLIQWSNSQ